MSDPTDKPQGQSPDSSSNDAIRPPVFRSDELLKGHREVWIEHGDELYRLRLTAAGKLYLTK